MKKTRARDGGRGLLACIACCLGLGAPAFGANLDFVATWSGAGYGNDASATARITIDDTALLNPGSNDTDFNPFIVTFTITVSGASSGNGTFTLADFNRIALETGPGNPGDLALDFSRELVGQDTGTDPWGTRSGGGGGDFNVFSLNPTVPVGVAHFALSTNGGAGDLLDLTSFRPVIEHTAWLKVKIQTKGYELSGDTLMGKAKAKGTCYWHLEWEESDPAGATFFCETTPGSWGAAGGAGVIAWEGGAQLLGGTCAVTTAPASAAGPCFFTWSWKAEADGALKSAKVRSVSCYLAGSLDGGASSFHGDCKLGGSQVSESKVPAGVLALAP
jgi:hypothetical protein